MITGKSSALGCRVPDPVGDGFGWERLDGSELACCSGVLPNTLNSFELACKT